MLFAAGRPRIHHRKPRASQRKKLFLGLYHTLRGNAISTGRGNSLFRQECQRDGGFDTFCLGKKLSMPPSPLTTSPVRKPGFFHALRTETVLPLKIPPYAAISHNKNAQHMAVVFKIPLCSHFQSRKRSRFLPAAFHPLIPVFWLRYPGS